MAKPVTSVVRSKTAYIELSSTRKVIAKRLTDSKQDAPQITGYQTIDALKQKYPGKFDVDKVKKFLGAEIKGESRNLQAKMVKTTLRVLLNMVLKCSH